MKKTRKTTGVRVLSAEERDVIETTNEFVVSCHEQYLDLAVAELNNAMATGRIKAVVMRKIGAWCQFGADPEHPEDLGEILTLVTDVLLDKGTKAEPASRILAKVPQIAKAECVRVDEAANTLTLTSSLAIGFDYRYRTVEISVQLDRDGAMVNPYFVLRHFLLNISSEGEVSREENGQPQIFHSKDDLARTIKGDGDDRAQARHRFMGFLFHLVGEAFGAAKTYMAEKAEKARRQERRGMALAVANRLQAKKLPTAKTAQG
ncbi:MAG: hypothetical protein WC610_03255 [Patescibacteria group bacterium]